MKSFLLALVLLFSFSIASYAAPYKGSKVPPDNLLMKGLLKRNAKEIVGKHKESDNVWSVFWVIDFKREVNSIDRATLVKLDTDVWVLRCTQRDDYDLIQE